MERYSSVFLVCFSIIGYARYNMTIGNEVVVISPFLLGKRSHFGLQRPVFSLR